MWTFGSLRSTRAAINASSSSSLLPLRPLLSSLSARTFSGTAALGVSGLEKVQQRYGKLPPYPYPARQWYKKSNYGLYGSARVRFGNNISKRTETRTRRRWYPNVQRKRLWSTALGRFVRTKVTTRVLRTIDKVGGLDEYLLGDTAARIKDLGPGGWALRWRVMRTDAVRERFRAERVALGLPEDANAAVAAVLAGRLPAEGVDGGILQVPEEDVGMSEEQLKEREAAIDRILDEDAERDAKGEDGGIELEALGAEVEEAPRSRSNLKW